MTRLFSCFALLSFMLLLGCGSNNEGVTGTITLDGQPLADAEVVFTPEEGGRPATAMTDSAGKYDLVYTINEKGAPAGKYIVRIRASKTKTGEDGRDVNTPEVVPPKYNQKSELMVEVKDGGANQFDFAIESE